MTLEDVINAMEVPFEFVSDVLKNKCDRDRFHFPSVRIPFWGIFYSPDWMKERIKKRLNKDD